MTFKIEFSDNLFRLVIISSNGEDDYLEAVPYCAVSSVVGSDGIVYGAYLNSNEPELDTLSEDENQSEMVSRLIKVYDITSWPAIKPAPGTVTLVETDFTDASEEEESETIDVEPV